MQHNEFKIDSQFLMSGKRYRCTDVGTRVAVAICLDQADESWYDGPTYAVVEHVIDEDDMKACGLISHENQNDCIE